MHVRRLSVLGVTLSSALLAGLSAAGAAPAVEAFPGVATDCAATLPFAPPEAAPPPLAIGEREAPLPGEREPNQVTSSCQDFCVLAVEACLAACPGYSGHPQYDSCRSACYDDYATCVNGCWEGEVPEGP